MAEQDTNKSVPVAALQDSAVKNSPRREVGPAEKVRRQNSVCRDNRTNLGQGKPSTITTP